MECDYVSDDWSLEQQALWYVGTVLTLGLLATLAGWRPRTGWGKLWHFLKSLVLLPLACLLLVACVKLAQTRLTQHRAHLLITALEDYRRQQGGYPQQLSQLVPGQLAAVPPTALGIFRPSPFYYRPSQADEAHSQPFFQLLYSYPKIEWQYRSDTREWEVRDEDD